MDEKSKNDVDDSEVVSEEEVVESGVGIEEELTPEENASIPNAKPVPVLAIIGIALIVVVFL